MARLAKLPPRMATMGSKLSAPVEAARSQRRRVETPWRRWYDTARWKRLRWSVLLRDMFICQMCRRTEADTSKLVADHKVPHRGDARLFWDAEQVQCLCATCHSSTKQREERAQGFT